MAQEWSTRTTYQGHRINFGTWFILLVVNRLLRLKRFGGETSNMTMVQGGYNKGGVKASAGTHDGGGAFDLTAYNWKWRVWLLRLFGCAAWYRPYNWDGRGGGAHIHVIVSGDGTASSGGKSQVTDYKNNRNGLANRGKDPNARPKGLLILFRMPKGTDLAVRYATKNTIMRTEPSDSSTSRGTLKKNAKFTPVALVKNGSGNYWVANVNGDFVYDGHLTKKKPIIKLPSKPVKPTQPVPVPEPTPQPTKKSVTLHIGTINVIRWRLGKKNVRGYDGFKKGADWSSRVKGLAKMQDLLGVSVFGTQESGQYKDADLLSDALNDDPSHKGRERWTNILHGDDAGDITQANHVHDKRKILSEGMIKTGDARQVAYHNTGTWTLLQDTTGSNVIFLLVNTHGEYREAGKTKASEYDLNREEDTLVLIDEAEKIAEAAAEKYGVKQVPIVFVGDFNQDKDDFYDGPGRSMKKRGYADCETLATSMKGPGTTVNSMDPKKTTGRRLDRIFIKVGTLVGPMITVAGYPYTDHNGVGVELTLTNQ